MPARGLVKGSNSFAVDSNSPLSPTVLTGVGGREATFFFGLTSDLPDIGNVADQIRPTPKVQKCSTLSFPFSPSSSMANLKSLYIPSPPIDFTSAFAAEPTTPKTPADEGIEFFELASVDNKAPIRIYELQLDPDGGPNKDRAVCFPLISLIIAHIASSRFSTYDCLQQPHPTSCA